MMILLGSDSGPPSPTPPARHPSPPRRHRPPTHPPGRRDGGIQDGGVVALPRAAPRGRAGLRPAPGPIPWPRPDGPPGRLPAALEDSDQRSIGQEAQISGSPVRCVGKPPGAKLWRQLETVLATTVASSAAEHQAVLNESVAELLCEEEVNVDH